MHHSEIKTFEELEDYLRHFTNFAEGTGAGQFDFVGAFLLLDALLDRLVECNSSAADFKELAKSHPLNAPKAALLKCMLAQLESQGVSE
jgi:hypothetical protein